MSDGLVGLYIICFSDLALNHLFCAYRSCFYLQKNILSLFIIAASFFFLFWECYFKLIYILQFWWKKYYWENSAEVKAREFPSMLPPITRLSSHHFRFVLFCCNFVCSSHLDILWIFFCSVTLCCWLIRFL